MKKAKGSKKKYSNGSPMGGTGKRATSSQGYSQGNQDSTAVSKRPKVKAQK